MTTEENAIQEFYNWEIRYRGYECYSYPVSLVVPYVPFSRKVASYPTGYDDGVSPSILGGFKKMFSPKVEKEIESEIECPIPEKIEPNDALCVIEITFVKDAQIRPDSFKEFLNTLSFVRYPVSFEIVGTAVDITIQFTCSEYDELRVQANIQAYFPDANLKRGDQYDLPFEYEKETIKIIDFGLSNESMLPLKIADSFSIDPLTSLFGILESLEGESVVLFQMIIEGVNDPLAHDIMHAVTDGSGESFFGDMPNMPAIARTKVESPLICTVMRVAVQSKSEEYSEYLAQECFINISASSEGEHNDLIPLPNEGYDYKQHVTNLFYRSSNRPGMLMSVNELVTMMHYPNNTIVSKKLAVNKGTEKRAPQFVLDQKYVLGENSVGDEVTSVSLSDEFRLSHTHVIGSTGVGKSTLLANLFIADMEKGMGGVLFDPHGDIVDDILLRVPENRVDDVILLDPSDTDFPIGFNLLHAETEAEKIVLSSDLVSAFKRYATAWGDRMTSVLGNAIDTFLDAEAGGTLIELKRFLLEKSFREKFLSTVSDPQLLYYWQHDFPLVPRASLSPLLIRIDTFLRPKIIRLMMAQRSGLELKDIVNNNKILLVKLSQGLIGKENAHLLGTLLVSKLGQVALARQSMDKSKRTPFYIYMDEFHNLVTDSISDMLSGVRKYGIGLVLAHQDMKQLSDNPKLAESVLSNPNIRICFRLGETDAKTLQNGFSGFDQNDLISLERGKAIMRIGGANHDFNIAFSALSKAFDFAEEAKAKIQEHSRTNCSTPRNEVEELLMSQFPTLKEKPNKNMESKEPIRKEVEIAESSNSGPVNIDIKEDAEKDRSEAQFKREKREHEQLKVSLGQIAQANGFRVVYEEPTPDGGRIDVGLHNKEVSIACEISVNNTSQYEVQNIQKCLSAKYTQVFMTSPDEKHLYDIIKQSKEILSKSELKKVSFFNSTEFSERISKFTVKEKPTEKIIKGYRVKVNFSETSSNEADSAQKKITETLLSNIKKAKKK